VNYVLSVAKQNPRLKKLKAKKVRSPFDYRKKDYAITSDHFWLTAIFEFCFVILLFDV
jgi:hypothetical protein